MIMLDTCAIIWDALDPTKLTKDALDHIDNADQYNTLIISDISIWEISMLIKKEHIEINATPASFINLYFQKRNVSIKAITPEIAELSVNFGSQINQDPADRIIAATSLIASAKLVTADKNLLENDILNTIW